MVKDLIKILARLTQSVTAIAVVEMRRKGRLGVGRERVASAIGCRKKARCRDETCLQQSGAGGRRGKRDLNQSNA